MSIPRTVWEDEHVAESDRPVLLYDGDCGFCTSSVRFVDRYMGRTRARLVPWQEADLASFGVTRQRAEYEVLWIDHSGRVYGGAQAAAKVLLDAGGPWALLGGLMRVPPFRWLAHWLYRLVSANRHRLPAGPPARALAPEQRPGANGAGASPPR